MHVSIQCCNLECIDIIIYEASNPFMCVVQSAKYLRETRVQRISLVNNLEDVEEQNFIFSLNKYYFIQNSLAQR